MYETLTYTGGVHKHEEIKELIEDLGGFVLQETTSQMDLVLTLRCLWKMWIRLMKSPGNSWEKLKEHLWLGQKLP